MKNKYLTPMALVSDIETADLLKNASLPLLTEEETGLDEDGDGVTDHGFKGLSRRRRRSVWDDEEEEDY